jgi:glycosyltransferase involved in cell wall biosynthesis
MIRTVAALLSQTRPPNEIIVLASDTPLEIARKLYTGASFYAEPNLNDWGHDKRAKGLDLATSDYTGWFNHDDSYDRSYIEKMMAEAEAGSDVVFCGWSKSSDPSFRLGSSTSGNYIVRTPYAREAGYTDRHYEADGTFINRLADNGGKITKVKEVLYFHNEVRD